MEVSVTQQIDWNKFVSAHNAAVRKLPRLLGNEVVLFSNLAFRQQGWTGHRFERWQRRKNPTAWGPAKRNAGRAILVDRGRLRRATRIIRADFNTVVVGNDTPYARAHNEGWQGQVTQRVKTFQRKQTFAGVASTFGKGRQFTTGAVMSIKTRKDLKPRKVQAMVQVKEHIRKIRIRLPRRQFMGDSPYLRRNMHRKVSATMQGAFRNLMT